MERIKLHEKVQIVAPNTQSKCEAPVCMEDTLRKGGSGYPGLCTTCWASLDFILQAHNRQKTITEVPRFNLCSGELNLSPSAIFHGIYV